MIVYHVTSKKKFLKYVKSGLIKSPVRALETIEDAERFSNQTGRKVILRLKFPYNTPRYEGHFNKAYIFRDDYSLENF